MLANPEKYIRKKFYCIIHKTFPLKINLLYSTYYSSVIIMVRIWTLNSNYDFEYMEQ